jgi:Zn-dependent protease with chaperone function
MKGPLSSTSASLAPSAYVISVQEISPGWVLLYAATFAIQVLCAAIRGLVAYPLLWLIFTILGQSTASVHALALIIGYGPLALSFATLLLPLGGWLWRQQIGGRTPSQRERLIYEDALAILTQADAELRPPRRWFVLDRPHVNAAAYADTLMLTRGLLESGHLEAVLAHELGHLNSSDSRLTAALHRLTTPPRGRMPFPLRTIGFLISGALGVWLTRTPWAAYWRSREFHADRYAARLGQGQALARFLDTNALEDDLPIPFMWLSEHSHPWTEHRIDRLYQTSE